MWTFDEWKINDMINALHIMTLSFYNLFMSIDKKYLKPNQNMHEIHLHIPSARALVQVYYIHVLFYTQNIIAFCDVNSGQPFV